MRRELVRRCYSITDSRNSTTSTLEEMLRRAKWGRTLDLRRGKERLAALEEDARIIQSILHRRDEENEYMMERDMENEVDGEIGKRQEGEKEQGHVHNQERRLQGGTQQHHCPYTIWKLTELVPMKQTEKAFRS